MSEITPYVHRDISWLDFNYRVLQEAKDPSVPLMERIKFLAIYSSNLDEYFRVRVANHRNIVRAGKKAIKGINFKPELILSKILRTVKDQQKEFSEIFENSIVPQLKKEGIHILKRKRLSSDQKAFVENFFKDQLLPFVQPVLLVKNKIKPFLNTGSLYLAIQMREKDKSDKHDKYAIVKIPSDHINRFIELPSQKGHTKDIILLDDIVRHSIRWIFPGYDIIDSFSIKLTRDAELYIDDEFSGDLIHKVKAGLAKRNVGPASRLVYDREMPKDFLKYLADVFELTKYDLLPEGRYHNNADFFKFPKFDKVELLDKPLRPIPIPALENSRSIFEEIRKKDHWVHVPYHSYESVIRFFEEAADDPKVTHIKIVQYRVASKSRIMDALMKAAKSGKQVSAFVEIKARFDEEANIKWGEKLQKAGVNVNYSMPGLKVHSKIAVIRRIEKGKDKIYGYLSTGNFHEDTARVYSDIGLFTSKPSLCNECIRIFSYLETKKIPKQKFKHLLVGLFSLKEQLIDLIKEQIEIAKNGGNARITLKMNSLQDPEMIKLLYKASKAGVKIKMIIRGICSLVGGIEGISDNIEVISIVDRFLEHARIFYFASDKEEKLYLSSADWMVRSLHYRVETVFPIYDPIIKEQIINLLEIQLNDNVKARKVMFNANNEYVTNNRDLAIRSQQETYYFIKRITSIN